MSDKPILFSGTMVRALLAGTKTQTRRVLKPQPVQNAAGLWTWQRRGVEVQGDGLELALAQRIAIGDRLWVRESWQAGASGDGPQLSYAATPDFFAIDAWDGPDEGAGPSFNYERCPGADFCHWLPDVISNGGPWRPSIHMPRWASRLTLTVTDVRVERLQDISDDDVTAEGCRRITDHGMDGWEYHGQHWATFPDGTNACCFKHAQDSYRQLWEIINGPGAWEANPWVAAYTFTVAHGNIDQLARLA